MAAQPDECLKVKAMPISKDCKQTVRERAQREPAFADALRDEALARNLKGEPEERRRTQGELVSAPAKKAHAARLGDAAS